MSNADDRLIEAVRDLDVDASLKLLMDAGGACQARDLASSAHQKTVKNRFLLDVNYSVEVNPANDTETLRLYLGSDQHDVEVAGIVQSRCKR